MIGRTTGQEGTMVWRLETGCGGYSSAAGNWVYCGTGHDHLRAMGLELIISVETIGCTVVLDKTICVPWVWS